MPYRVEEVRFKIEPVRLTLVELDAVSAPGGFRKSAFAGSLGVGGALDSLDGGVTSKGRRGRGRRMRGCSAIVYGWVLVPSFLSVFHSQNAGDRVVSTDAHGSTLEEIRAVRGVVWRSRFVITQFHYRDLLRERKILQGEMERRTRRFEFRLCDAVLWTGLLSAKFSAG